MSSKNCIGKRASRLQGLVIQDIFKKIISGRSKYRPLLSIETVQAEEKATVEIITLPMTCQMGRGSAVCKNHRTCRFGDAWRRP